LSADGTPVAGSVSVSGDAAIFDSESDLSSATTYTATLTIADANDNHLAKEYTWSFTTAAIDTSAPTVQSTTPVDGKTDVTVNTDITVTFSEPCDIGI
jgi:hypothetical protein